MKQKILYLIPITVIAISAWGVTYLLLVEMFLLEEFPIKGLLKTIMFWSAVVLMSFAVVSGYIRSIAITFREIDKATSKL